MKGRPGRRWLVAAIALAAGGAEAQAPAPRFDASPLLPEGHWAVRAAWRAEALGLAPGFMPAQRAVPRAAVAAALEEAAARAGAGSPYAGLAEGWRARFAAEFREYEPDPPGGVVRLGSGVAGGYARRSGEVSPATGVFHLRTDAVPLEPAGGPRLGIHGGAALGRGLAVHAEGGAGGWHGGAGLRRWDAVAGAGAVSLSAGRGEVGYGPGRSGGIVLSTAEPLARLEAQTTRPLRLPRPLGVLGSVSAHTFATRLDDGRHEQRPWLWGARVALRPHARLTLGVNRASVFGGEGRPVTLARLGGMLLGILSEDFENQVVAVDARWRAPVDGIVPATLYLEWGAEDAAGAWVDQPARTFGVLLPSLPWLPWMVLGAEHTSFSGCCDHGVWYTHATFGGNWARADALLGHPLGGEGRETTVYAEAELPGLPLRLDAAVFVRDRSAATPGITGGGNLLAPAAAGRGRGGELRALLRLGGGVEAALRMHRDAGGAARARRAEAELRYHF